MLGVSQNLRLAGLGDVSSCGLAGVTMNLND